MVDKTEFEKIGEQKQPGLPKQLLLFVAENKKWWLLPIVLCLMAFGVLITLASTGAAPFIYTMF